jgi:hypothetical protein
MSPKKFFTSLLGDRLKVLDVRDVKGIFWIFLKYGKRLLAG